MLGELLDVPALTYATSVDTDGTNVTIKRQTLSGYDVVTSQLPAVVSVTAGVVEPRYPTFKGIMDAKNRPMETVSVSDLRVQPTEGQQVTSITAAPEREAGRKVEDEGEAFIEILAILKDKKVT